MFVAGFDPALTGAATEIYSIYIGGTHWDEAYAIAVAPDGSIWLAGGTYSPDIWIQGSPYQGVYGGDGDALVVVLRHEDDGGRGYVELDDRCGFDSVEVGEVIVDEHDVGG